MGLLLGRRPQRMALTIHFSGAPMPYARGLKIATEGYRGSEG